MEESGNAIKDIWDYSGIFRVSMHWALIIQYGLGQKTVLTICCELNETSENYNEKKFG